jgi:putative transcriptional regulator
MKNKLCSLEGNILVASPSLEDKFFEKSLIYVFMHDSNGALGVILNQTIGSISNHDLIKLINKKVDNVKAKKMPILFGGPINTEKIIALSINKQQEKKFSQLNAITLHTDMQNFVKDFVVNNNSSKILLARGISAWNANQLEAEIEENSWFIMEPDINVIFSQQHKKKWSSSIEKIGIKNSIYVAPYSGHA